MSLIGTAAAVSNGLQIGGAALSLGTLGISMLRGKGTVPGIAGVAFGKSPNVDIVTEDHVSLKSDITDHYTEDNYSIQDHVAFQPVRYTLTGVVSELVYTKSAIEKFVQATLDRLGPLNLFSPEMSQTAARALSEYNRLSSAVESAANQLGDLAGAFGIEGFGKNKQQKAFKFFNDLRDTRAVVSVETPWTTYPSMLLESVDFTQGEENNDQTQVTIVFKEFRAISTVEGDTGLTGRIAAQASNTVDMGVATGKKVDDSYLYQTLAK